MFHKLHVRVCFLCKNGRLNISVCLIVLILSTNHEMEKPVFKEGNVDMSSCSLCLSVGSMANKTLCFLTIHSAGQLILLPYGHPEISAPNYDELVSVCASIDLYCSVKQYAFREKIHSI